VNKNVFLSIFFLLLSGYAAGSDQRNHKQGYWDMIKDNVMCKEETVGRTFLNGYLVSSGLSLVSKMYDPSTKLLKPTLGLTNNTTLSYLCTAGPCMLPIKTLLENKSNAHSIASLAGAVVGNIGVISLVKTSIKLRYSYLRN
jgi:hypothetical protein